jgi:hypothetical protein
VRRLLGETFALLGAHLDLLTVIALSVWLPGAVFANYLEFFEPDPGRPARPLLVKLAMEVVFGPLVAGATVAALARVTRGLPASYGIAMAEGVAAWGRLFLARLVTGLIIAAGLAALIVPGIILAVRYALIDPVVVLEGAGVGEARRRSSTLTAGQRSDVFLVGGLLLAAVTALSLALSFLVHGVAALNHFVVRVLADCVLAVAQTVFSVAWFLLYRRRAT